MHLNSGIFHALDLLSVRPQCKAQLDNFDIVLATWVHLVHILLKIAQTEQQLSETFQGAVLIVLKEQKILNLVMDHHILIERSP